MNIKSVLIGLVIFISTVTFSPAFAVDILQYNDYVVSRTPEHPSVGQSVTYSCRNEGIFNYQCLMDPDNYGPDPWKVLGRTSFSEPGINQVGLGFKNCGTIGCNSFFSFTGLDYVLVSPVGGWSIDIQGPTTAYTNESVTFSSTSNSAKDCCTYNYVFSDTNTHKEDKQTDGTSRISYKFTRAGQYRVKVYLEEPLTDADIYNGNNRVEAETYITIIEEEVPAPSPVTRVSYWMPLQGWLDVDLYAAETNSVWYSHELDSMGNGNKVKWSKPYNTRTRIQYKVDFGPAGRSSKYEDLGWTTLTLLDSQTTETWLYALPGPLYNTYTQFYPFEPEDATSQEYTKVYYRFRNERTSDSKVSEWTYLKPMWLWYQD